MRLDKFLISLLILTACDSTQLQNAKVDSKDFNAATNQTDTTSGSDGVVKSPDTDNSSVIVNGVEVQVEPAVTPIIVAGASLTCLMISNSQVDFDCKAVNNTTGLPYDFKPSKAYMILSTDLNWTEVNFQSVGLDVGHWKITIPSDISGASFAIGMKDDKGEVMIDWVNPPKINLVKDGNFEAKPYDPANAYATQYYNNGDHPFWSVYSLMKPKGLCGDVLEINTSLTATGEIDTAKPNQWVELNSTCPTKKAPGNKSKVYQNIMFVKDHIYVVEFKYKRRALGDLTKSFEAWIGSTLITSKEVTETKIWMTFQTQFKAKEDQSMQLAFAALGEQVDAHGVIIDDVAIYDSGKGVALPTIPK